MLHFDRCASTSTSSDLTQCTLYFDKKVQTSYVLVDSLVQKEIQTTDRGNFAIWEILNISNYDAK